MRTRMRASDEHAGLFGDQCDVGAAAEKYLYCDTILSVQFIHQTSWSHLESRSHQAKEN